MEINYRDLAERALWTAVQAFLGVFTVGSLTDSTELKSAALAGAAAAVSAVLSLVKNLAKQKLEA